MYNIMTNELITSNGSVNFADMAKVMGVATAPSGSGTEKKTSQLARVKILREAIMGTQDVNGKKVNAKPIDYNLLGKEQFDQMAYNFMMQKYENTRNTSFAN